MAIESVISLRKKSAARDTHRGFSRPMPLAKDDLVLVIDEQRKSDHSSFRKLTYRWFGPYFIEEACRNNVFKLRTPDGILLSGTYPPRRLKKFVNHAGIWEPEPLLLWQDPGDNWEEEAQSSADSPDDRFPDLISTDNLIGDDQGDVNNQTYQDWSWTAGTPRPTIPESPALPSNSSLMSSDESASGSENEESLPRSEWKEQGHSGKTLHWHVDIPFVRPDDPRLSEYLAVGE